MIFCPKGEEHWRSLDKIEDVWKIEAPKYGMSYESYITFGQDKVFFSYQMGDAVSGGTKQIVHKDTGIALDFERYTYARENRTGYHLLISDTNVPGRSCSLVHHVLVSHHSAGCGDIPCLCCAA